VERPGVDEDEDEDEDEDDDDGTALILAGLLISG